MKAVILARGLGTRMRQNDDRTSLTESQSTAAAAGAKGMMPVGGPSNSVGASPSTSLGTSGVMRPFLDYVLSALADAGCTSICLVVAPEHASIRDYYDGSARPSRLQIAYAVQPIADGTARAVQRAHAFAANDPFLVLNSDNLYPAEVLRALVNLDGPGLPAFERDALVRDSGFPPDRIAGFAALEVDTGGHLTRIIEKPGPEYFAAAPHALVSMNLWRFDQRIFEACADVPLSPRGEYELPEAAGLAVTRGVTFRTIRARGAVLDLSHRRDIALVTERLTGVEARL